VGWGGGEGSYVHNRYMYYTIDKTKERENLETLRNKKGKRKK
jgi:hypothetical protein